MLASLTNTVINWFIDILYLVWIMTELWQLFSCFEYQSRFNTLNTDSSEFLKRNIWFWIGIQTYKNLTKNKKKCSTQLNPFILSNTNYWKGWYGWRFMLIVVCHFVISCLSFFDWWILTTSLVSSFSSYIWNVGISSLRQRWP